MIFEYFKKQTIECPNCHKWYVKYKGEGKWVGKGAIQNWILESQTKNWFGNPIIDYELFDTREELIEIAEKQFRESNYEQFVPFEHNNLDIFNLKVHPGSTSIYCCKECFRNDLSYYLRNKLSYDDTLQEAFNKLLKYGYIK